MYIKEGTYIVKEEGKLDQDVTFFSKVALSIIIPYRDRKQHLNKFLPYMQARLPKAEFIIVEQVAGKPFNRGKLLNIGSLNASGNYYALHDVDMLPVKSNYDAPIYPTLLATKVQKFRYKIPFPEYFGGVVLITAEHMKRCNGYHNEFWGWGGEDNNFRDRVLSAVGAVDSRECTYNSLPHKHAMDAKLHPKNVALWQAGPQLENGLSNCEYKILSNIVTGNVKYLIVEI